MGLRTSTGGGKGGGGTTQLLTSRGSSGTKNLTIDVAGERRQDNLTAIVGPLLVVGRMALPLPPTGSGRAFFAVPPAATVPQANTAEDNKDNCARMEDACNERGHGEDAHRDRGRQQEEVPAEEGQPDCRHRGGAAAQ
jgi:hypothetical protein